MRNFVSRICSNRWLNIGCRLVLALVFVYAAVGKIEKPGEFADSVIAYRILPIFLVNLFAITLPWVELFGGLSLLPRASAKYGALTLLGMNVIFMVAIGLAIVRGLHIDCGCFTQCSAGSTASWLLILRDGGLILLCLPILSEHQTA